MPITHTQITRRLAAYHEAGHFVSARVSGIPLWIHYVTVEPREQGGGCVGFEPIEGREATLEQEGLLALGGQAAECYGALCDHCKVQSLKERPDIYKAALVSLQGKVSRIFEQDTDFFVLRRRPDFKLAIFEWMVPKSLTLIDENWPAVDTVAETLEEETTLFHHDADTVMQGTFDSPMYRFYRRKRRVIKPPQAWVDRANEDFPAGDYFEDYEDFTSWLKIAPGETPKQWADRCNLSSEDVGELQYAVQSLKKQSASN